MDWNGWLKRSKCRLLNLLASERMRRDFVRHPFWTRKKNLKIRSLWSHLTLVSLSQQTLQASITNDIQHGSGTNIGAGLEKGIQILTDRQTRNPVSALLLLTDGQDTSARYNYSQLMQNFPTDVICHTFGYGSDHMPSLLVELAEQGNGGTFTYVVRWLMGSTPIVRLLL